MPAWSVPGRYSVNKPFIRLQRTKQSSIEAVNAWPICKCPGHKGTYEFGTLTEFAYKYKDGSGEIIVATTRLETMLGDVAVAVNSKDPRYTNVIGKEL